VLKFSEAFKVFYFPLTCVKTILLIVIFYSYFLDFSILCIFTISLLCDIRLSLFVNITFYFLVLIDVLLLNFLYIRIIYLMVFK